jgi:hypothetical protein
LLSNPKVRQSLPVKIVWRPIKTATSGQVFNADLARQVFIDQDTER